MSNEEELKLQETDKPLAVYEFDCDDGVQIVDLPMQGLSKYSIQASRRYDSKRMMKYNIVQSNRKVKVNGFKKSIAQSKKDIYEKSATRIGAKIEYSSSVSDSGWDDVYLLGNFSDKQKDDFHNYIFEECRAQELMGKRFK